MTAEHAPLLAFSRWLTPMGALFAFALLANWPPGTGVGFAAGLAIALPIVFNALLLGVRATLGALPHALLRLGLVAGLVLSFVGAGLPNMRWSAQLVEAGAGVATASSVCLALLVVMGRAGTFRDSSW
jgi:hypothetical protein